METRTEEAPITSLTLVTALVVLVGVVNRRGFGIALACAGATPIGAAAIAGGVAVPTFYAVAIGAAVGLGLRLVAHSRGPTRDLPAPARVVGLQALLLFGLVAAATTVLSPMLFDGTTVFVPEGPRQLSAGYLTTSNIAQVGYLFLGIAVVFFLARARWATHTIIGITAITSTLLSFWAWSATAGVPYPAGLFDNSPDFVFQEILPGGAPRVRGIFSEPAGLATSSLITAAYAVSLASRSRPRGRVLLYAVAGIAIFLGAISTSTTFFIAGAVLAVLAALAQVVPFARGRHLVSPRTLVVLCGAAVASLWLVPVAVEFMLATIDDKVGSSSYDERSGSDAASLTIFLQTGGIGAGLGANRASSLAATLLSTVGAPGTLLLVLAIASLTVQSRRNLGVRPAVWAMTALLITKVISGPDLNDTNGILWMALGVMANSIIRHRDRPGHPAGAGPPTAAARSLPTHDRATALHHKGWTSE